MTEPRKSRAAPFSVRLSAEQHARLDRERGGISKHAYALWLLFGPDARSQRNARPAASDERLLSAILAKFGQSRSSNNLNQIAKAVNSGLLILPPDLEADLREAITHVAQIRQLLVAARGLGGRHPVIIKASQRGDGAQLGQYLLRAENEHLEIHQVRGFMADDLRGAMKEADAIAKGTKCVQHLFSLSLNPPGSEPVSVEAFEAAADRVEKKMNLTGQPRIMVLHENGGRRHMHVAWSRIDADTMTARPMSHFKRKLREVSKELYLEHGWKMPRGLADSKERDAHGFTQAEWQQAKRIGRDPKQLKALIQECWATSDSSSSFSKELEKRGLHLAKGDRRTHVAVTYEGEVLSVARMIGKKGKEVTAKLGSPDGLRSVTDTKQHIAEKIVPRLQGLIRVADQAHARELQPLEQRRQDMTKLHQKERQRMAVGQQARTTAETRIRAERFRSGVAGLWDRLTGKHAVTRQENDRDAFNSFQRDRAQRDRLVTDQLRERRGLQKQIQSVRDRHATRILGLHRDLAKQRSGAELPGQKLTPKFHDASTTREQQRPRAIVRGRTTGRQGPTLSR